MGTSHHWPSCYHVLHGDPVDLALATTNATTKSALLYQGKEFSGTIDIRTEMLPCDSCADVMTNQFKAMFGTDITVTIEYGVEWITSAKPARVNSSHRAAWRGARAADADAASVRTNS